MATSPALILRHAIDDLLRPSGATVPGLDALRTLAMLMVFSGHTYGSFAAVAHASLPIGRFPLFYFGWTGVDLFFVLSGYLIGKQLWRELADTSSIRIGRFLLRRGLRIWPYYFSFLAVNIALGNRSWVAYWPDLAFLSNYIPGYIAGGWSLSTEEQFYLLVPVCLLAGSRAFSVRRLWLPAAGLLVLLPCLREFALATHGGVTHGDISLEFVTYAPFHTHSDGLVVGLLLSWMSIVRPEITTASRFITNIRVPVVAAATGVILRQINGDLFAFTGLALIYGAATLFALRDQSIFRAVTRLRVFHIGSRLSYAIYLNHFIVLGFLERWVASFRLQAAPTTTGFLAYYAIALSLAAAAAAITFVVIESPFLQLRDAWLRRTSRMAGVHG